jgi:hypothetical protein
MSQTISVTQPPESSISTIFGAYYEHFWKEDLEPNSKPEEPEYRRLLSNSCVFQATLAVNGPSYEDYLKFRRLVSQWHSERAITSSVTAMVMCPSYQKIIGMGEVAIPLILGELQSDGNEPDHWFWALRVLTEVDPVNEEDRGDIIKMSDAWLQWGLAQGYGR